MKMIQPKKLKGGGKGRGNGRKYVCWFPRVVLAGSQSILSKIEMLFLKMTQKS